MYEPVAGPVLALDGILPSDAIEPMLWMQRTAVLRRALPLIHKLGERNGLKQEGVVIP